MTSSYCRDKLESFLCERAERPCWWYLTFNILQTDWLIYIDPRQQQINIKFLLRIIQLVSGRTSTQIAMQLNYCQKQCNAITAKYMVTQMRLIAKFLVIKWKHNIRLQSLITMLLYNSVYTNKREIFQLKLCHVQSELGRISGDWKSLWGFSVSSVLSNKLRKAYNLCRNIDVFIENFPTHWALSRCIE